MIDLLINVLTIKGGGGEQRRGRYRGADGRVRRPDHATVTSTLFSIKPSHLLSAIFDDTDFLDWKLIGLLTSAININRRCTFDVKAETIIRAKHQGDIIRAIVCFNEENLPSG